MEAKGVPRLLPSCVTKVAEGMSIITASPRLTSYRQMALELLVAEKASTAAESIEAIHGAVALPVDDILNDAVGVMEK